MQRLGAVLLRFATIWWPFFREWAHSLENELILSRMSVLHRFAIVLQRFGVLCFVLRRLGSHPLGNERSALIWCHFAALCNDLVSFCSGLQRFGGYSLKNERSALIWNRFAAFCNTLMQFCCFMLWFGTVLLRSALIGGRFTAFCISLVPFCFFPHWFVIWCRSATFCSDLVLIL